MVRIVLKKYYTDLKPLENDENTLKSEMSYRTSEVSYIFCVYLCHNYYGHSCHISLIGIFGMQFFR